MFAAKNAFFAGDPYANYDSDARAWIQAVEAADVQYLEAGVRDAMNQYVLNWKASGMWSEIISMTVKMGARTLAGALIDVKNPSSSWANFNFVSGDYNRVTGLAGNGTTKYLSSGITNDSIAQDDFSCWIHMHTMSATDDIWLGAGTSGNGSVVMTPATATTLRFRNRNGTVNDVNDGVSTGLVGMSRSGSANFGYRSNNRSSTLTRTSQAPNALTFFEYATNSTGSTASNFSNSRHQITSIGNAMDLVAAEGITHAFIAAIEFWVGDAGVWDADADAWLTAVEAADGQALEPAVRYVQNKLIKDLKAASIYSTLGTMVVKSGARTLTGALIDVVTPSSSWTNNGFDSADYDRLGGLGSDGSQHLDTGYNNNVEAQNSFAMWTHVTETDTTGLQRAYMGTGGAVTGASSIRKDTNNTTVITRCRQSTANSTANRNSIGLIGISRAASGSYTLRAQLVDASISSTSQTPQDAVIYDYAHNVGGAAQQPSTHRSIAAGIGSATNLEEIDRLFNRYKHALQYMNFL